MANLIRDPKTRFLPKEHVKRRNTKIVFIKEVKYYYTLIL